MKKTSIIFALVICAAISAYASSNKVTHLYFYFTNNDPENGEVRNLNLEIQCDYYGFGCVYQEFPGAPVYQLYREYWSGAGTYYPVKQY